MRSAPVRSVAWRRADEAVGHSAGRLAPDGLGGWVAHGTEVLIGDGVVSCSFRVALDARWRTRAARVAAVADEGERTLGLTADDARSWTLDDRPAPFLDGCLDVDVAATPLTNTFPIRRLADLPVGRASTAPVAWVEVPSLRVLRVEQTYRRLGERAWEYSDPRHGAFRLEVDADGLVLDYEGFATRVAG